MMNFMLKLFEVDFNILYSLLICGIMNFGITDTLVLYVLEMISEREMLLLFFHNVKMR